MRKFRFHFLFATVVVLAFGFCSWLVMGDDSPFYNYFLWHVGLPNFYRRLHMGAYVVSMILSGNVHQPSPIGFWAAASAQWFVAGFLLSFVFTRFRTRGRNDTA